MQGLKCFSRSKQKHFYGRSKSNFKLHSWKLKLPDEQPIYTSTYLLYGFRLKFFMMNIDFFYLLLINIDCFFLM